MNIMDAVVRTELDYLKCFCSYFEDEDCLRFSDDYIEDMYSHNLTYLKKESLGKSLSKLVDKEIIERKGKDFLVIQYDCEGLGNRDIDIKKGFDLTNYAYYQLKLESIDALPCREDAKILKVNAGNLEDALDFDIRANGVDMGESFIRRRFERRSKVYLSEGIVDSYLCYHEGNVVGHCDLFISEGVAKIEDLDIVENMQRKGFGTTMLKEISSIARSKGAFMIYLVTDEDDTAKEMYQRIGMIKIGEKTDIMIDLESIGK